MQPYPCVPEAVPQTPRFPGSHTSVACLGRSLRPGRPPRLARGVAGYAPLGTEVQPFFLENNPSHPTHSFFFRLQHFRDAVLKKKVERDQGDVCHPSDACGGRNALHGDKPFLLHLEVVKYTERRLKVPFPDRRTMAAGKEGFGMLRGKVLCWTS